MFLARPANGRVWSGDHNSGAISERSLNCSAVVGWRGWSCDARVVFAPRAAHSRETSARSQRREELAQYRGTPPRLHGRHNRTESPLIGHTKAVEEEEEEEEEQGEQEAVEEEDTQQLSATEKSARGCPTLVRETRARLIVSLYTSNQLTSNYISGVASASVHRVRPSGLNLDEARCQPRTRWCLLRRSFHFSAHLGFPSLSQSKCGAGDEVKAIPVR